MRATAQQALPAGVQSKLIYQCAGPAPAGVGFRLRLAFRDATRQPATAGQWNHEWVVSREDLEQAEASRRSDQALLDRREREVREFLEGLESMLRRDGLRLERMGRELVLRRSGV